MRPSHEVCIGLLGVKALALQESDVAAFLRPAEPGAEGAAGPNPHSSAEDSTILQRSPRAAGPSDGAASRPLIEQRASTVSLERAADNPIVASIRVRVFANGKVCIEMSPSAPKPPSGTGPE